MNTACQWFCERTQRIRNILWQAHQALCDNSAWNAYIFSKAARVNTLLHQPVTGGIGFSLALWTLQTGGVRSDGHPITDVPPIRLVDFCDHTSNFMAYYGT